MSFFSPPLRPPGAVSEKRFLHLCVRCGQCAAVCPHKSIRLRTGFGLSRRTPEIDPKEIPCYLCMKCPPACPTGALDASLTEIPKVAMGQAYILKDRCHNYTDGIMCMTCYDRCPLRGSAVVLDHGLNPAMTTACVGCGVCVYVCPADAVTVIPAASPMLPPSAVPPIEKGSNA
ncbi:MAG: 4Fe-4S dicluster domain-containing protein [Desulfovibrionaceae bacterium]|nr:4Fe-4S dicluster domain-containing protein [Desulfovibrionaceae bacterium]